MICILHLVVLVLLLIVVVLVGGNRVTIFLGDIHLSCLFTFHGNINVTISRGKDMDIFFCEQTFHCFFSY